MDTTRTLHLKTSFEPIALNDQEGKVLKVSTLNLFNKSQQAVLVNLEFFRAGQRYVMLKDSEIAPGAGFGIFRSKDFCVYLEKGDMMRLSASSEGSAEAVCSYESIDAPISSQARTQGPRRLDRHSFRSGKICSR